VLASKASPACIDFNTTLVVAISKKTYQAVDFKQKINIGTALAISTSAPLVALPRALNASKTIRN
jgi:hypothetical protein